MRYATLLLLAFLPACTVVGHEKVDGWPELKVVEHHVPHPAMRDRCMRYAPFGASPEACAEFDFANRTCHIWFSSDFPPADWIVRHERLHCAGYDHIGSGNMRRLVELHLPAPSAAAGGSAATARNKM